MVRSGICMDRVALSVVVELIASVKIEINSGKGAHLPFKHHFTLTSLDKDDLLFTFMLHYIAISLES